jgi:hypothetical protein
MLHLRQKPCFDAVSLTKSLFGVAASLAKTLFEDTASSTQLCFDATSLTKAVFTDAATLTITNHGFPALGLGCPSWILFMLCPCLGWRSATLIVVG